MGEPRPVNQVRRQRAGRSPLPWVLLFAVVTLTFRVDLLFRAAAGGAVFAAGVAFVDVRYRRATGRSALDPVGEQVAGFQCANLRADRLPVSRPGYDEDEVEAIFASVSITRTWLKANAVDSAAAFAEARRAADQLVADAERRRTVLVAERRAELARLKASSLAEISTGT